VIVLQGIVLGVLPFITIVVFVAGMWYRFAVWRKLPAPGMTLYPAPEGGTWSGVIKESLLFPGLFKTDKVFWGGAWMFHVLLALICIGHIRVFTDFPALWAAIGLSTTGVDIMSAAIGGAAGVLILLLTIYLMVRRISVERVREVTGLGDFIALLLVLAILLTGNSMRFGSHFDLELTRTYFAGLFTFSSAAFPTGNMFMLHFLLVQLLIMYIPFSKLLHFGGIFFSQMLLRRA
jgi:nitrate reductase gamma subunit